MLIHHQAGTNRTKCNLSFLKIVHKITPVRYPRRVEYLFHIRLGCGVLGCVVCQTARGCFSRFQWPVCTESGLTNFRSLLQSTYLILHPIFISRLKSGRPDRNDSGWFRAVVSVARLRKLVRWSKWPWNLYSKILSFYGNSDYEDRCVLNLVAPDLFLILAHPVYKMWIIQEPNTLELWNKLHFEERKKRRVYTMFKIFSTYIWWINI